MNCILGISLPPGPIEPSTFNKLIGIAMGPHGWIRAVSYGSRAANQQPLRGDEDPVASIYACMLEDSSLVLVDHSGLGCVNVRADRHRLTYDGMVYVEGDWVHFVSKLAGNVGAVSQIMALLRSPFAFAAATEAVDAFATRWRFDEFSQTAAAVSGVYSQALEHPHFRMWFGVEWTDFLGRDVLAKAPALESRPEGAGWFVQILEEPEDWARPEGIAAANEFAAALGRNVFYDSAQPDRPLEAPDLSPLMRMARSRYPHLRAHPFGWPPKLPPQ